MTFACIGTRRAYRWAALGAAKSLAQPYSPALKALECGDMSRFTVELVQITGRG